MTLASKTRLNGFTLIELLVVMAITAFAISLAAPISFDRIEKFRVMRDERKLENYLKYVGFMAFSTGCNLTIAFEGQAAQLSSDECETTDSESFPKLTFESQRLTFSKLGLPDAAALRYVPEAEKEKQIEVVAILSETRHNG